MIENEMILAGGFCWNQGKEMLHETRPEWFTDKSCKIICAAVQAMDKNNIPIDMISVLKNCNGIGNEIYTKIYTNYSGQNLRYHWAMVHQSWTRQQIKQRLSELSYKVETADPFEVLKETQNVVDDLQFKQSNTFKTLFKLASERADSLDHRRKQDIKTVGLRTGWDKLDKYIGGFVPGEMIVIAGRPGMGKTALGVCLAISHAKHGGRVCFFSIEMSETQIGDRALAYFGQLDNMRIRNADVSDLEMERIYDNVSKINMEFYIETSSTISIDQIRARVKCMNPRPTIVVIDYMQLIHSKNTKVRQEEVSYISRQCKLMAKDCGVTVIALAQLSREVEKRANNRPQLSDLRESGAIEQDADTVLFPYRPQYYKDVEPDALETDCELIISKCRNGITGSLQFGFRGSTVEYVW